MVLDDIANSIDDTMYLIFLVTRYFYTEIDCITKKYRNHSHNSGGMVLQCDNMINSIFQLRSDKPGRGKLGLTPGWQLHLYVSQLPCR